MRSRVRVRVRARARNFRLGIPLCIKNDDEDKRLANCDEDGRVEVRKEGRVKG